MDLFCRWCKEFKPAEEFARRSGLLPYSQSNVRACKECNSKRNRDRYMARADVRTKQAIANRRWKEENRERFAQITAASAAKAPWRGKARARVKHLLRRGYWTKQPCCLCGAQIAEAHHDSYAKQHWEIVRWLCKEHHEQWHVLIDPIKKQICKPFYSELNAVRKEANAMSEQLRELRKKYREKLDEAEALELKMWNQVIEKTEPHWKIFSSQ